MFAIELLIDFSYLFWGQTTECNDKSPDLCPYIQAIIKDLKSPLGNGRVENLIARYFLLCSLQKEYSQDHY